ncbi:MAG: NfeD family protein [Dehalococcoidales bacterium]|nr:NfeD family protein [Dehalococcoidales bacterium]
MKEKPRIMLTILVTLLEEIALVIFIFLGLPMLGIEVPLGGLIAMMAGIATYGVISYRLGSRVLRKKPVAGLSDMVGIRGEVVKKLAPVGTIRIGSELWDAKTDDQEIEKGNEVIVVKREGLKLIVRKDSLRDATEEYLRS